MSKTIEILKFLRVMPEKKKLIQVRGKLFSTVDDIPDERVKQVVLQSIAEMVKMAGGYERLAKDGFLKQVAVAPEKPDPDLHLLEEADLENLIEPTKSAELEVKQPDAAKPIPALLDSRLINKQREPDENRSEPQDGSLLNRFRSLTGRTVDTQQTARPSLDLAGQINEILQEKIEGSSAYRGLQAELRTAINGDMVFIVNGRSYDSVNDILDTQSADLFRMAIAEWEAR